MSATSIEEVPLEVEEFRPHRKWFQRPDILVPLVLVVIGYALLIGLVEEKSFFRARMEPAGGLVKFDAQFFFSLVPLMWQGLLVTLRATLIGFLIAIFLGFFFALGRRSRHKWLSWPTAFVVEFIRSTPLLVQLVFWQALSRAAGLDIGAVTVLAVGLGIHYATYTSEAYRAGINSVDAGQWEAATALNLGPVATWTRVVIPQAVPNVLPALGNNFVAAFKDAPMGVAVSVPGLLFFADQIKAETFRVVEPYMLIGIGFLLMSLPAAWAVRRLEKRISYERL